MYAHLLFLNVTLPEGQMDIPDLNSQGGLRRFGSARIGFAPGRLADWCIHAAKCLTAGSFHFFNSRLVIIHQDDFA